MRKLIAALVLAMVMSWLGATAVLADGWPPEFTSSATSATAP